MTSERENQGSMRRLSDIFAVLAACIFIGLAAYRIQWPGLYYDEVNFLNAAEGAHDNTFIYAKPGPIPLLIMPYPGGFESLDLCTCSPPLQSLAFNHSVAGYPTCGSDTADSIPRHARHDCSALGCHRRFHHGG